METFEREKNGFRVNELPSPEIRGLSLVPVMLFFLGLGTINKEGPLFHDHSLDLLSHCSTEKSSL